MEIGTTKLRKVKIPLLEMAVPLTMEMESILIGRDMVGIGFKVRNDFNGQMKVSTYQSIVKILKISIK